MKWLKLPVREGVSGIALAKPIVDERAGYLRVAVDLPDHVAGQPPPAVELIDPREHTYYDYRINYLL